MGLSSADLWGLWNFQPCPGTARNSSAELQGMSICLLLCLGRVSLGLFQPMCGTDYLWGSRLKGKQTKAMIWAPLREQSWESFKSWLQRQGG